MRQFFKRLLLPVSLVIATQTFPLNAESIRLIGPNGEIQSAPQFSEAITRSVATNASGPFQFYGPTGTNETLWGIASALKPARSVSVQQTLYAIYQLNPQAFEQQNIHSLIPGSRLRIPSFEQVANYSVNEAVRVMDAHQRKLDANAAPTQSIASTPVLPKVVAPKQVVTEPVPTKIAPKTEPTPPKVETTASTDVITTQPEISTPITDVKPIAPDAGLMVVEKQLEASESEVLALEEKNHQLRMMLSQVQVEVDSLKEDVNDDERIRTEVEKLLEKERKSAAYRESIAPTIVDQLLGNMWFVALLASIPSLLLVLIIVLLVGRKGKSEEVVKTDVKKEGDAPELSMAAMGVEAPDDMSLDDDLFSESNIEDELFGDDSLLDADPLDDGIAFDSDDPTQENQSEEDDIFAGLNDDDLDFNLDEEEDPFASIGDDGDLDANFDSIDESANGISVDGDDKALGLQEMERALDEFVPSDSDEPESMGEFDLADDGAMSQDDIEALLAGNESSEDLGSDTLDQSVLDDLLGDLDSDDDTPGLDLADENSSVDDFDIDELIAESSSASTSSADPAPTANDTVASSDDIDDIFNQVAQENEASSDSIATVDDDDFDIDAMINANNGDLQESSTDLLDDILETDDIDDVIEEDSTELLDEMVAMSESIPDADDIDALLSDNALEDESTELFDELITVEDESDSATDVVSESLDPFDDLLGLDDEELSLEDDALLSELDELTDELDSETDIELESTETLDELLQGSELDEPLLNDEEIDGSDESNSAFDELLADTIESDELSEDSASSENDELDDALDALEQLTLTGTDNSSELESVDSEADDEVSGIEQSDSIEEENRSFNRDEFIDDLFDVAPETDALLDDVTELTASEEQAVSEEPVALEPDTLPVNDSLINDLPESNFNDADSSLGHSPDQDGFVFEPSIEGSDSIEMESDDQASEFESVLLEEFGVEPEETQIETEAVVEPASKTEPLPEKSTPVTPSIDAVPNEFGMPQDDDWLFDEPDVNLNSESVVDSAGVELEQPADLDTPNEEVLEQDQLQTQSNTQDVDTVDEVVLEDDLETNDDTLNLEDFELPEFGEEQALAAMAEEPPAESEAITDLEESEQEINLDDLELPEFSEEQALAAMVEESPAESEAITDLEESEQEINLDDFELPEFGEEQALAAMVEEPPAESEVIADLGDSEQEINFDDFELPEFGEEQALAAMAEEPSVESEVITDVGDSEQEINFDDFELPEFGEEQALESVSQNDPTIDTFSDPADIENSVTEASSDVRERDSFIQADNDQDALHDIFSSSEPAQTEEDLVPNESIDTNSVLSPDSSAEFAAELDEQAITNLLSEDLDEVSGAAPLDSVEIDSAGMDIDTMLTSGEDWAGFSLEDNPSAPDSEDASRDYFNADNFSAENLSAEPEIANEDWSQQDQFASKNHSSDSFMSIDELMAQSDDDQIIDPDSEELKLNVGLDEFPDVLGDVTSFDVDDNAEAAGKLDLAKMYIEMNDPEGARKLLEEAIVYGSDDIRREAKALIDTLVR